MEYKVQNKYGKYIDSNKKYDFLAFPKLLFLDNKGVVHVKKKQ